MPVTRFGSVTIAALVAVGTIAAAVPAQAQDRPTGVAEVRVGHQVRLLPDGSITVGERVSCDPAWQPAELDVTVGQGESYGDTFVIPDVPCDNAWHHVTVRITDFFGSLHKGKARVNSQFLVTNIASGDSAGAHQQAPVMIVPHKR